MVIEIEEIVSGKRDGEIVYICDYRYNNLDEKPIRKVLPQKVIVRSNSETKKRIHYSNSHFCGLNKKDEVLKSKVIPVFDNTGYRYRTGTPVNVFDSMEECKEFFNTQKKEILENVELWYKSKTEEYNNFKKDLTCD